MRAPICSLLAKIVPGIATMLTLTFVLCERLLVVEVVSAFDFWCTLKMRLGKCEGQEVGLARYAIPGKYENEAVRQLLRTPRW